MMRHRTHAFIVSLAFFAAHVQSYPALWARRSGDDCLAVPETAFDLSAAPHALPTTDSNITIAINSSDGTPATTLCPGASYSLQVTVPGEGHYLLTSTYGAFGKDICLNNQACKNRACSCDNSGLKCEHPPNADPTKLTNTIKMPCDAKIADGTSNVFQVLYMLESEARALKPIRTNKLTMKISTAGCPATCNAPSPSPSPAPAQQSITVRASPARVKVGATSTVRATFKGVGPPAGTKRAKVAVSPSGIVQCTPLNPRVTTSNQVTMKCKGVKAGKATVTITYDAVTQKVTGNRATLTIVA